MNSTIHVTVLKECRQIASADGATMATMDRHRRQPRLGGEEAAPVCSSVYCQNFRNLLVRVAVESRKKNFQALLRQLPQTKVSNKLACCQTERERGTNTAKTQIGQKLYTVGKM